MTHDTRIAVAAEFEMTFAEPGDEIEWDACNRHFIPINPGEPLGAPSNPSAIRPQMEHTYRSLRPTSDEEAETQRRWLEYAAGDLSPSDVINFRIYQALSKPRLAYAKYPLGSTYSQVIRAAGEAEFRGPGIYQQGWYDNPGFSEARLSPVPSEQFQTRRDEMLSTIGQIAASEGRIAYLASQHTNASAFRGEVPILGDPRQNLRPYLAVATGLRRVFREGALLNPKTFPRLHTGLFMGYWRDCDIRMPSGRAEYRGHRTLDGPDYKNGLRFLLTGMKYGLDHATEDEIDTIQTAAVPCVAPPKGRPKEEHLYIVRAIESCIIDEDGSLHMAGDQGNVDDAFTALLGRKCERISYDFYRKFFTECLSINEDGYMYTDEQRVSRLLNNRCVAGTMDARVLSLADIPAINARLRQFPVKPTVVVGHKFIGLDMEHALRGLEGATAFPAVDPDGYAELQGQIEQILRPEAKSTPAQSRTVASPPTPRQPESTLEQVIGTLEGLALDYIPPAVQGIEERIGVIAARINDLLSLSGGASTSDIEVKISALRQAIQNLQGASEALTDDKNGVTGNIGGYIKSIGGD